MDARETNEWLKLGGTILAILVAIYAAITKLPRWFRVLRAIHSSQWLDHFGKSPAEFIRGVIHDHSAAIDLLEAQLLALTLRDGIGLYVCDATTGNCIHGTRGLEIILGLPDVAIHGTRWVQAIEESDRERVWSKWQACVTKKLNYEDRYTVVNQSSRARHHCHTEAFYISTGSAFYVGYVEILKEPAP